MFWESGDLQPLHEGRFSSPLLRDGQTSPSPPSANLACSTTQGQGTCPDGWKLTDAGKKQCTNVNALYNRGSCNQTSLFAMDQDQKQQWATQCGTNWHNTDQLTQEGQFASACFHFCQGQGDCGPGAKCDLAAKRCVPASGSQCASSASEVGTGICPDAWEYDEDDPGAQCHYAGDAQNRGSCNEHSNFYDWSASKKAQWAQNCHTYWFNTQSTGGHTQSDSCPGVCFDGGDCQTGWYCDSSHQCQQTAWACSTSAGCPEGFTCSSGSCAPQQGYCKSDAQCAEGQTCSKNYQCTDIPGYCSDRLSCPDANHVCVNHQCTLKKGKCVQGQSNCDAGQQCVNGNCTDIPGYCDSSHPCPTYQTCDASQSRCTLKPGYCESGSDCQGSETCDASTHQCTAACAKDTDCAAGDECVNGTCQRKPTGQCSKDADCKSGQVCVKGACQDKPTGQCSKDADCKSEQVCVDGSCQQEKKDEGTWFSRHKVLLIGGGVLVVALVGIGLYRRSRRK